MSPLFMQSKLPSKTEETNEQQKKRPILQTQSNFEMRALVEPHPVHDFNQIQVHSNLKRDTYVTQRLLKNSKKEVADNASPPNSFRPSLCPFGGACHACPNHIQTKLAINQPEDQFEQEANLLAKEVMQMPEKTIQANEKVSIPAQPYAAHTIVRKVLHSYGQPLNPATRGFMESRLGHDFTQVRIHTNDGAKESAKAVNALAYTMGQNIVFGEGRYNPDTYEGKQILAHELVHVVQQTQTSPNRHSQGIQRLVDPNHVSCDRYANTHPTIATIGTTTPTAELQAADTRALEMLNNVIGELTYIRSLVQLGDPPAWPLISDVVGLALRNRLRLNPEDRNVWTGTGPRTVEIIIRWFGNIRFMLQSGLLRYTCLGQYAYCGSDAWAYVFPPARRIYLCLQFWGGSLDNRALTLIHEAAHLYYGLVETGGGAGNVNCLEHFLADLNNVPVLPGFVGACRPPS